MKVTLTEFVWVWNETQHQKTPRHHRQMCRFLTQVLNDEKHQALMMAFRDSGKSTIVGLFCAWVLLCRPETRILILSADWDLAKKMVRNIKRIIERHPLTQGMKPKEKDQWASDRFTIRRDAELRDPSVLARGLGANITGSRADIIVCDDVEVPNTCDTPQKRVDLRQRLSELAFVLVPGGLQLFVGTPHAYETIYNTGPGGYLQGFERLFLPLLTTEGKSVWPERFSLSKIEEIRRRSGPRKFSSQMMLAPVPQEESRLNPDKLLFYEDEIVYHETNLSAELKIGNKKMVSASAWWDPSFGKPEKGDSSVLACVFTDEEGRYYLHAVEYLKVPSGSESAAFQCQAAAAFVQKYHLPSLSLETNGIGKFLPELLKREFNLKHLSASILGKHSTQPKTERILEAFDALLAAGGLYVHKSVQSTPFLTEMREWCPGANKHDDGLDAVAGCLLTEPVRLPRVSKGFSLKPDWRFGHDFPILNLEEITC